MKPRIFIGMHYMELGGAEISLIGLLQALNYEKVDVDLFVYSHQGALMKMIPEEVNFLPENAAYSMFEKPLREVVRRGYWRVAAARLIAKVQMKAYAKRKRPIDGGAIMGFVGKSVSRVVPNLYDLGDYDLAISFLTPHNFVLDHVKAKKKVCWIHTDYTKVDLNAELELSVWGGYDKIVAVSEDVKKGFVKVFPSLEGKVMVMENILSSEFVRKRAEEKNVGDEMSFDGVKLVSVGRFCEAKNYDNVPDICKKIREKGVDAKWYIIGFGGDEELIRKKIAEAGMEECVVILGKKENPYPYIKACDIYVQPSRYEGKSVTVREAQMLCKPVVVANYPTAASQINDGVDGVIVPLENEGCASGIVEFVKDVRKREKIVEYLGNHDYGNVSEIHKIYEMLGV